MEIPKPLLLADIIVRLQITKNDVYTPLSRTGKPASRPPSKTAAQPEGVGEGDPPTVGGGAEGEGQELATGAEDEKVRSVHVYVCACLHACIRTCVRTGVLGVLRTAGVCAIVVTRSESSDIFSEVL